MVLVPLRLCRVLISGIVHSDSVEPGGESQDGSFGVLKSHIHRREFILRGHVLGNMRQPLVNLFGKDWAHRRVWSHTGSQVVLCYGGEQKIGELYHVPLSTLIIDEAGHDHLENPVALDDIDGPYHLIETFTSLLPFLVGLQWEREGEMLRHCPTPGGFSPSLVRFGMRLFPALFTFFILFVHSSHPASGITTSMSWCS